MTLRPCILLCVALILSGCVYGEKRTLPSQELLKDSDKLSEGREVVPHQWMLRNCKRPLSELSARDYKKAMKWC